MPANENWVGWRIEKQIDLSKVHIESLEVFLMIMYWSSQTLVLPYGTCTILMQITCFLTIFFQSGIFPTICLIGVHTFCNVWPLFYFIIVCRSLRACNVLTYPNSHLANDHLHQIVFLNVFSTQNDSESTKTTHIGLLTAC